MYVDELVGEDMFAVSPCGAVHAYVTGPSASRPTAWTNTELVFGRVMVCDGIGSTVGGLFGSVTVNDVELLVPLALVTETEYVPAETEGTVNVIDVVLLVRLGIVFDPNVTVLLFAVKFVPLIVTEVPT